jgi:hypothetical protein
MTFDDIEAEATWTLSRLGFDDSGPPPVLELARRILGGSKPVDAVPHRALRGDGQLARVGDERRIYVRSGLTPARLRWAIAHELGHFVLGVDSSSRENEAAADAFAAAITVPRRAFEGALLETGSSYRKLAEWFATTESCVALRWSEVTREPLALVTPLSVRTRGDDFGWPAEAAIRALAQKSRAPGVRKARLSDDRRRVALRKA